MNRIIRAVAVAVVALALGACASSEYIISTTSGMMITTTGKPELDEKAGVYTYKDSQGRSATIKKEDVKQIMER